MSPDPFDTGAAEALDAEVMRLADESELPGAISVAERAIALREASFGKDHLELARPLNTLAMLHQARGEHAEAGRQYERAFRIRVATLGAEHPTVASSLHKLAATYEARGAPGQLVEPLYERALRIRERAYGPEHPRVARSLNDLAMAYQAQGAHAKAEPLHDRALRICRHALGDSHPHVARSLNNLAILHEVRAEYAGAESLAEHALVIREEAFGPVHPDVAASLGTLAAIYMARAAYARAEPLLERARRVRERLFGADHPHVARSLDQLGMLHLALGSYAQASQVLERALRIREATLGDSHPELATSRHNLGLVYRAQGRLSDAASLLTDALELREGVLGAGHPDVARTLNSLAGLYRDQGAYTESRQLCERARRIIETVLGSEHPELAAVLGNLGMLELAGGAYGEAERLHHHALRLRERTLGAAHPHVATSLCDLARLHTMAGAPAHAEPLYERALGILEAAFGADSVHVAGLLTGLAACHSATGERAKAERCYERALRIYENTVGREDPLLLGVLSNLATLCWANGAAVRALSYFVYDATLRDEHVRRGFVGLPESRKRQFVETQHEASEILLSFHAHGVPDDGDALGLAVTTTLRRKGRILTETAMDTARGRASPSDTQDEIDKLREVQAMLQQLLQNLSGAGDGETLRITSNEVKRHRDELTSQGVHPPGIAEVQAALPGDATLVEFVRYQRFDPDRLAVPWREAHYVAYVIQRHGPVQWVALGQAEPLEAAVSRALSTVSGPAGEAREPLRDLHERVFAPIQRRVGTATTHFLLSPDAMLHLVPFAALIDASGHYLVERLHITYLTSGRDLVRSAVTDEPRSRPLVIALSGAGDASRSIPGAEREARALRSHFEDAVLHIGSDATKDKLLAAQGPLFVHVATHAWFGLPAGPAPSHSPRSRRQERDVESLSAPAPGRERRPDIEDVLDESGLLVAGSSETDRILTARELSAIDLRGTQLAVLSACDTGTGEVTASEGVYGLRRALAVAGAQTQIVSLWKVDDDATALLMDRYYGALRNGAGRSEALRQTQLELLRDAPHAHPFYWAAFVPIGVEGPLSVALRGAPDTPEEARPDAASPIEDLPAGVNRYDPLEARSPEDFAGRLAGLGKDLATSGRHEAALVPLRKAIELYRGFAAREPGTFVPSLVRGLVRLAHSLAAVGQHEPALRFLDEAVELAAESPEDCQLDLLISARELGDACGKREELPEALRALHSAVAIGQALATKDPDNAEWQSELAITLAGLSDVYRASSRLPEALQASQGAVALYQTLAARKPDDAGLQHDLSCLLEQLCVLHVRTGNLPEAQQVCELALAKFQKLAANDPEDTHRQVVLSEAFLELSQVHLASGKLPAAVAACQDAITILQKVAAREPGNVDWQRDRSIAYVHLGDVHVARSEPAEAAQAFQEAIAIRQKMVAGDPDNLAWQRLLSSAFVRLGDVCAASSRPLEAMRAFQEAIAIRQRIAATDPDNAASQRDLAAALEKRRMLDVTPRGTGG